MEHTMKFSCSDYNEADFKDDGLRPFFKYRDLGIRDATNGRVVAHVIRAIPGKHVEPQRQGGEQPRDPCFIPGFHHNQRDAGAEQQLEIMAVVRHRRLSLSMVVSPV